MVDIAHSDSPTGPRVVVHLLRHGLVENPRGILYGRLPGYHLSEIGHAMATRVASYFDGADVTYVASSPLERAGETAAPLARTLGVPVVTDTRLIEPANIFEGTAFGVGDGVIKRPRNWVRVRDPFTPSWGEPYLSIARRMMGAVYAAVQGATGDRDAGATGRGSTGDGNHSAGNHDAAGHEAVLVSHQLPIWTMRRFLEGKRLWHNPARRQCSLASVTSLTFEGGVLTGIRYREPAADLVPEHDAGSTGA